MTPGFPLPVARYPPSVISNIPFFLSFEKLFPSSAEHFLPILGNRENSQCIIGLSVIFQNAYG